MESITQIEQWDKMWKVFDEVVDEECGNQEFDSQAREFFKVVKENTMNILEDPEEYILRTKYDIPFANPKVITAVRKSYGELEASQVQIRKWREEGPKKLNEKEMKHRKDREMIVKQMKEHVDDCSDAVRTSDQLMNLVEGCVDNVQQIKENQHYLLENVPKTTKDTHELLKVRAEHNLREGEQNDPAASEPLQCISPAAQTRSRFAQGFNRK